MKKIRSILLATVVFCLASPLLTAESDDPSETFLKAYMTAQQGEKLEHENQFKAALAKYRFSGSLIKQLSKAHPDWQPAIVEYLGRKVSESILRVQDKTSTQESVNAPAPPAENAAAVPPEPAPTQVAKGPVAPLPAAKPAPASTPNEVAIEQATRKLRDRVDQLEAELQKSRTQMSAAENEKQSLNSRLDETKSKLGKAQGDLDKAKTAEKQVRDQLTQAQASLKKTAAAGSNEGKAQEALRSEIAQLKKVLVSAQEGRSAAEKERDDANTKVASADQQRASASKERDEANARAARRREQAARAGQARWRYAGGDGQADKRERNVAQHHRTRASGRGAARSGEKVDAGRVRQATNQIGNVDSTDPVAGPAGDEVDHG